MDHRSIIRFLVLFVLDFMVPLCDFKAFIRTKQKLLMSVNCLWKPADRKICVVSVQAQSDTHALQVLLVVRVLLFLCDYKYPESSRHHGCSWRSHDNCYKLHFHSLSLLVFNVT